MNLPDSNETENIYYMFDPETKVIVFNETGSLQNIVGYPEGHVWDDKQQVSAYTNMIEIVKWWRSEFNRNSWDGQGMPVKVVTHERIRNERDNAFWGSYGSGIYICDASDDQRSSAAAIDFLTHESTHAVFGYRIDHVNFPYANATGAINEGYADIFACLKTRQWLWSLNVHADGTYERNISDPKDTNARQAVKSRHTSPIHYSERYISNWLELLLGLLVGEEEGIDHGYVHRNSSLISYPAYLMSVSNDVDGLTWEELGKVWYKSMRMGYSAASDYFTVRRCVLRAARKIQMPDEKIEKIKDAFNEVGITETSVIFSGRVSTYTGTPLPNVGISITLINSNRRSTNISDAITDANGYFSIVLPVGTYSIDIVADGYVPFNALKELEEGADNILKVSLVPGDGMSRSRLVGTVRDALTGNPVEGALFEIRRGWNIHTGYTAGECLSEADGSYDTVVLLSGYYTVEVSKEGYAKTEINDLAVPPDTVISKDIILVPESDNKYRVTLQWEANPRDLDSHLIGKLPDGSGNFHVYFGNKSAEDSQGNAVATLDHDDTKGYGFETITFEMKPNDTFRYYVHWYSGTGTWGDSNAVVNLYKAGQMIGSFSVPDVDSGAVSECWHVFDLTSGMNPVQPPVSNSILTTEPTLDN